MPTRTARVPAATQAYVLHRYDWSETSLILDVFTREQGRLVVAAKGAKRPYSQLRGVLLPFQRLMISVGKLPKSEPDGSASEVQNLRGAEWAGGPPMLAGAALFSGFYVNELLMKLTVRQDAQPSLFDAYADTLPALSAADDATVQSALRAFEVRLLSTTGVLPDLSLVTLTQAEVEPGARYALSGEAGVTPARQGLTGEVLVGLQAAIQHGSLQALQQVCRTALPELRAALRGLLHYHLGTPVLRTRQVMLDVQSLHQANANTPTTALP